MPHLAIALLGAIALTFMTAAGEAGTLATVKARGLLHCGVNTGIAGFSAPDDKGAWAGIDVDVCRAVASAVLGDATKVKYVPLTAKDRFTALQSGEVDMLSRNTSWTMSRDTALGLTFTGVTYYDHQAIMVKKALGVKSAKQLGGASVCIQTGTTTELNASDFFRTNKLDFNPVIFEKNDETIAAYNAGRCDAFTSDESQLYAERIKLGNPDDHVILPEVLSKEPLGPAVRQGDDQWAGVVRWSLYAMIDAEELGLTQQTVEAAAKTASSPEVRRLLGLEGEFGKGAGLPNDWALQIVKQVGTYGESFNRNLGEGSDLHMKRGFNALWRDGGLQYAPPVR